MAKALIVVDMLNDFVNGKLGGERAQRVVPRIKSLIERARSKGIQIVYVCDAHRKSDPEIRLWGEHAMKGTWGSEIVDELKPAKGDWVLEKRCYDAFHGTKLHEKLLRKRIRDILFAGVATNICVQNSLAEAFYKGYNVAVVEDCVEAPTEDDHRNALKYMQDIYGAKLVTTMDV